MNSFGNSFRVEISGESRGRAVTVMIDGVKPGVKIDEEIIGKHLSLRRPSEVFETERAETDRFEILSGVYGGFTTGTPVCVAVFNDDASDDGLGFFRPGHADYTQYAKYGKTADIRGGGHASGRITVGLSVAGALAYVILAEKRIFAGTRVLRCCGVSDAETDFSGNEAEFLSSRKFPVLDNAAGAEMKRRLSELRNDGETAGAILETGITGIPAGVGEPFFAGAESEISRAVF
ncbi:MAG: chorismate synthase, partial [Clostridia bacterium]|nr:chorismate synthase [Clostridia bacterium]